MRKSNNVKIIVFVPASHADRIRKVISEHGGGVLGNYSNCTFSVKGTGRFLPENGAKPAIGKVGRLEAVAEERIEFVCLVKIAKKVVRAIKNAHPYEEVTLDIYRLEEL